MITRERLAYAVSMHPASKNEHLEVQFLRSAIAMIAKLDGDPDSIRELKEHVEYWRVFYPRTFALEVEALDVEPPSPPPPPVSAWLAREMVRRLAIRLLREGYTVARVSRALDAAETLLQTDPEITQGQLETRALEGLR